jgi:hypothetical protein
MKAGEGIRHNRSTRGLRDTMVIFVLVGTHTASEDRRRCRDDCDPQLVAALAGAATGLESAQSQILNNPSPSHPQQRQRGSVVCWLSVGLIRPEKLGIDPPLQAIALYLDPVPLPVCNLETRAFAGGPKNSPVSRWHRPDVYAGTL